MTTLEVLQTLTAREIKFFQEYRGDFDLFRKFLLSQFPQQELVLEVEASDWGGTNKMMLTKKGMRGFYYLGSDVVDCYTAAIQVDVKSRKR